MGKTEERMADYAASLTFEELPEEVVRQAKRRVIDTLGGALAAYTAPTSRIACRLALPVSGPFGARVFGSLVRTSPDMAAFANGCMVRYFDLNDTHRTVDGAHPSDNLSGVLAAAEAAGASGRDFLLALTIAYEIQARFVDSVPFNDAGWDQPVPGVMSCALGAGRLLGLDRGQLLNAISLAIVPNLATHQTRAGELSMWKGCAAANGARQGVFAALLAREGMVGPFESFDGVNGLWKQTMGAPYEIKPFARGSGTYAITQSNIKKYPVRDSCQLPVDTALELHAKVAGREIESLRIETYRSAYKGAVQDPELWAPKTRETADHSMLIAVATALLDGEVTVDTFARERFRDADVLGLIGRTRVEVVEEFSRQTPEVRNCRLTAVTGDGDAHVAHRRLTREDIARGLSEEELIGKFESLTRDLLPAAERRRLLDLLWDLENLDDAARLVDRLAV